MLAAREMPFKHEEEFERYIHTAQDILSGIFILKRQVPAGSDIPDMVGVDRDNNVVIIENKNVVVDEEVLSSIKRVGSPLGWMSQTNCGQES